MDVLNARVAPRSQNWDHNLLTVSQNIMRKAAGYVTPHSRIAGDFSWHRYMFAEITKEGALFESPFEANIYCEYSSPLF